MANAVTPYPSASGLRVGAKRAITPRSTSRSRRACDGRAGHAEPARQLEHTHPRCGVQFAQQSRVQLVDPSRVIVRHPHSLAQRMANADSARSLPPRSAAACWPCVCRGPGRVRRSPRAAARPGRRAARRQAVPAPSRPASRSTAPRRARRPPRGPDAESSQSATTRCAAEPAADGRPSHARDGAHLRVKIWADARTATCSTTRTASRDRVPDRPTLAPAWSGCSRRPWSAAGPSGSPSPRSASAGTTRRTYRDGRRLQRCSCSKDGTGNINDLMREGYRLPSGPTSSRVPTRSTPWPGRRGDGLSTPGTWTAPPRRTTRRWCGWRRTLFLQF